MLADVHAPVIDKATVNCGVVHKTIIRYGLACPVLSTLSKDLLSEANAVTKEQIVDKANHEFEAAMKDKCPKEEPW